MERTPHRPVVATVLQIQHIGEDGHCAWVDFSELAVPAQGGVQAVIGAQATSSWWGFSEVLCVD